MKQRIQSIIKVGLLLLLLISLIYSIFHSLVDWPTTDEADYLYQSWLMSIGKHPYLDFQTILLPLGQVITSGIINWVGLHITAIRSVILLGWLIEIWILYQIGKSYLPKPWLWILVAFLWLTDTRYLVVQHHFWSGLTALGGIYCLWQFLRSQQPYWMIGTGLLLGMTFWITQSLGGLLLATTLVFLLFYSYWGRLPLRGIPILKAHTNGCGSPNPLPSLPRWYLIGYFLAPVILVSLIMLFCVIGQSAWHQCYQDTIAWHLQGHYQNTTLIGYFPTLGSELHQTIFPLIDPNGQQLPWVWKALFLLRIPIAFHMVLIGLLPWIALITLGLDSLQRVRHCEASQRDDVAISLWLGLGCLVLILSTFSYCTSMHLVSNTGLAYLFGFVGLYRLIQRINKPIIDRVIRYCAWVLLVLLHIGALFGAWMQLTMGVWLPCMPNFHQRLLYPGYSGDAESLTQIVTLLAKSQQLGQSTLVLYQSPELYLASGLITPYRYTIILPFYTSDNQIRDLVTRLQFQPPLLIVVDKSLSNLQEDPRFTRYTPQQLQFPILNNLLFNHYRLIRLNNHYAVFHIK